MDTIQRIATRHRKILQNIGHLLIHLTSTLYFEAIGVGQAVTPCWAVMAAMGGAVGGAQHGHVAAQPGQLRSRPMEQLREASAGFGGEQ